MTRPPEPKRVPFVHREHGIERPDPYHWLKDRDDPDTLAHLTAENAYLDQVLDHAAFKKALYAEMLARIVETDQSVPYDKGPYRYYTRMEEGRAYPIHCRRPRGRPEEAEEIVLDHNRLAEGHAFYQIGGMSVSPNHDRVAWLEDVSGAERYVLRVRDIATHEPLVVEATDLKWGLVWAKDNRTLFVTGADHASRPADARRVSIGGGPAEVIYTEPDEMSFVSVGITHDEGLVLVGSESKTTSEWRWLDAFDPAAQLQVVMPRRQGVEYDVEHHEGVLLVRTNEGGKNFELKAMSLGAEGSGKFETWSLVPHRSDVLLEGVLPFRRHFVYRERAQGLPRLRIASLHDGTEHTIAFPEPAYDVYPERNAEFDTTTLRFVYTSLITPRSVVAYDLDTRERTVLKEDPVKGGYDRTAYTSVRLLARSKDGTEIPISLAMRKDCTQKAPLLLYGYGAYGMSMPVWFSSSRLSLLDRGVVFAVAHIRGGSEMGRLWYDTGKLGFKQNTFDDFIAAAEHLVSEGYTTPDRLAVEGGSAGGLLIGAVVNQRPDLFTAAVAGVPFVDTLNTMLDDQLPLTITEYEEWGNPTIEKDYHTILAYAPYENIRRQRYPAILATAGLNDPRVGYWEAAKWVLKLRDHLDGGGPILLYTNLSAGHGGASGRYQALEELALVYTFLLDRWGLAGSR